MFSSACYPLIITFVIIVRWLFKLLLTPLMTFYYDWWFIYFCSHVISNLEITTNEAATWNQFNKFLQLQQMPYEQVYCLDRTANLSWRNRMFYSTLTLVIDCIGYTLYANWIMCTIKIFWLSPIEYIFWTNKYWMSWYETI